MNYSEAALLGKEGEYKNLMGINYVRPPLLKFKEEKETKDYTEYIVHTFKDAKESADKDCEFTNDIDSLIFCKDTLTIQVPKPAYMKTKSGKSKFAYAFGMFPNPKNGKAAYLDGCILGALGLKRQKTLADVICFITHDISLADKKKLEVVFDKVIYVPYISPFDMGGKGKLKTIQMDPDIFKNCPNYTKEHPYSHVFFKLHVFNPDLFPYEKVCFVDSDLVPLNYYDSLFMLDAPAGWVEYRKKWPFSKAFHWDRCDYLTHGKKIPKIFTDIGDPGSSDINAGLFLVQPDKKEYNSMIKELTSPVKEWMGPDKYHKGFYDFELDKDKSLTGRKFIDSSYCYPEQNYLTKRYSGEWTYIEYAFQSWSLDPCNSFGIHMAAFNPKPWFKQPANSQIKLKKSDRAYFKNNLKEIFVSEIPKAVTPDDESLILENISISYEIFNDLIIWGLVQYSELHHFFLHDTAIYGTKLSFGDDIFKPLSPNNRFKLLKDITISDPDYRKLSISQQYISNLINNYSEFSQKVKDNYLSVCKTKLKDRYGKYAYDYQIINYPGFKDKSLSEEEQLLKHGKISFGKLKGVFINDLSEDDAKFYTRTREFQINKNLQEAFYKSKYKHLVKSEGYYASKKKKSRKRSKKKKNKRGGSRRIHPKKITKFLTPRFKKKRKNRYQLLYFKMDNCPYCKEFENGLLPKLQNMYDTRVINRKHNPKLVEKYGIKSYPSLVRTENWKLFEGERTLYNIMKFLEE
tara:strand:- start:114 stop:2345 length:2232 start_codon:yes stop_codon:yes gene_type:complete